MMHKNQKQDGSSNETIEDKCETIKDMLRALGKQIEYNKMRGRNKIC